VDTGTQDTAWSPTLFVQAEIFIPLGSVMVEGAESGMYICGQFGANNLPDRRMIFTI